MKFKSQSQIITKTKTRTQIKEKCDKCNKKDSVYTTKFYPCGDCGFRVYCQKCAIESNWKPCINKNCIFFICENCKICCKE